MHVFQCRCQQFCEDIAPNPILYPHSENPVTLSADAVCLPASPAMHLVHVTTVSRSAHALLLLAQSLQY